MRAVIVLPKKGSYKVSIIISYLFLLSSVLKVILQFCYLFASVSAIEIKQLNSLAWVAVRRVSVLISQTA